MKLSVRTTIVALGTAAAMSVTGLTAPAMAADSTTQSTTSTSATATSTPKESTTPTPDKTPEPKAKKESNNEDTGDAAYAARYHKVSSKLKQQTKRLEVLVGEIKGREGTLNGDSDAEEKLDEAINYKNLAQVQLDDVNAELSLIPKYGKTNDGQYGTLNGLETDLNNVSSNIDSANSALKLAKPFKCDAAIADENEDNSGSASFLNFGSLFSALGSSGQQIVVKNGKKSCVNTVEYYSDQLKSIVGILTVVFTVITTVTKIGDTIQKQVAPKN